MKLRTQPAEKPIKLRSAEVKEFYWHGKTFASVLLPLETSPQFLQILENGRVMLYEYFKATGATTYIQKWYARKDNGPMVELKANWGGNASRKQRKEGFESLINDDAELFAEYNKSNAFDHERILYFIKQYNSCVIK